MKKYNLLFVMLILFVCGLLFQHWETYRSSMEEKEKIKQTVFISHEKNTIKIKQEISNIPDDTYKIVIPKNVKNLTCSYQPNKNCLMNKNQLNIKGGKVIFTFNYTVPKETDSLLLTDWGVNLPALPIDSTQIEFSEYVWRNGSWVSNSDRIDIKRKDLLDYYLIKNNGDIPFLYWESKSLRTVKYNDWLTVYSPKNKFVKEKLKVNLSEHNKLYVVLSEVHDEINKDNFLILNANSSLSKIRKKVILADIENSYSFPKGEEWYSKVIASVIANEALQTGKVEKMYTELTENLNSTQLQAWIDFIYANAEKKLDSEKLDKLLGKVTGTTIHFFSLNTHLEQPFSTLLQADSRNILFNGKKADKIKIIINNEDQPFISLLPLLEAAGYEVEKINKEMITANKGAINYKFFPDQRFFQLNEQRYGMSHAPIVHINDEIYVELHLLSTFFNLKISENEHYVTIQQ